MHWSHSQDERYNACPLSWYLRYRTGLLESISRPALVGGAAHACVAEYTRHLVEHDLLTDVTAIDDVIDRALANCEQAAFVTPGVADEVRQIVEPYLHTFILPPGVAGIECRCVVELDGLDVVAVIDRLEQLEDDSLAVITDYKSGWRVPSRQDVERNEQLQLYAWVVSRLCPRVERFRVAVESLRYAARTEVDWDLSVVARKERKLRWTLERVSRATDFPATPGEFCGLCGYVAHCPVAADDAPIPEVLTTDTAEALAGRLTVLDQQRKAMAATLKAYCNAYGPVSVGGAEWGFQPRRTRTVDAAGFCRLLQECGQDPTPYLRVDGRALRGARDAGWAGQVEALTRETVKTVFGQRKAEKDEDEPVGPDVEEEA